MKKIVALLLTIMMLLGITSALAADYPSKGITLICPWTAGGGTDSCLRALGVALEKVLGVTVTVENKTGGGGVIGHTAIAMAKLDGYILGMITFELSIYVAKGAADISYADYIPLARINTDAASLVTLLVWLLFWKILVIEIPLGILDFIY